MKHCPSHPVICRCVSIYQIYIGSDILVAIAAWQRIEVCSSRYYPKPKDRTLTFKPQPIRRGSLLLDYFRDSKRSKICSEKPDPNHGQQTLLGGERINKEFFYIFAIVGQVCQNFAMTLAHKYGVSHAPMPPPAQASTVNADQRSIVRSQNGGNSDVDLRESRGSPK